MTNDPVSLPKMATGFIGTAIGFWHSHVMPCLMTASLSNRGPIPNIHWLESLFHAESHNQEGEEREKSIAFQVAAQMPLPIFFSPQSPAWSRHFFKFHFSFARFSYYTKFDPILDYFWNIGKQQAL